MYAHGISYGMRMGLELLVHGARSSGRTTRMLDGLKDGDRIITCEQREMQRLQTEIRMRGIKATVEHWPVRQLEEKMHTLRPLPGRTLFDHLFVEDFWRQELQRSEDHWKAIEKRVGEMNKTADSKYSPTYQE